MKLNSQRAVYGVHFKDIGSNRSQLSILTCTPQPTGGKVGARVTPLDGAVEVLRVDFDF